MDASKYRHRLAKEHWGIRIQFHVEITFSKAHSYDFESMISTFLISRII